MSLFSKKFTPKKLVSLSKKVSAKTSATMEDAKVIIPKGEPVRVRMDLKMSKDDKPYINACAYLDSSKEFKERVETLVERACDSLGVGNTERSTIGVRFDFGRFKTIVYHQDSNKININTPEESYELLGPDFSITGLLDGSWVTKTEYNGDERLNYRLKLDQIKVYPAEASVGGFQREICDPDTI